MNRHPMNQVLAFAPAGGYALRVEFADGSAQTIDFRAGARRLAA